MRRVTLALLLAVALPAAAQDFPEKPVHLVVPFPPGGGTDTLARLLTQKLSVGWGVPVVVENRPGAAGAIGAAAVIRAPADGYTLLMASTGTILALASRDNVRAPAGYDVARELAPITLVAAPPYLLVAHPAVPVRSVGELIRYASTAPGKVSYGSSGIGAASHLAGELFGAMAGIELLHVPYKGTGQALADLLGGQVALMFGPAPAVIGQVRTGKLRALATTAGQRSKLFPEIPTVAESGVPGYEAVGWFGLFAPAGTPAPIVATLNRDSVAALAAADVVQRLAEYGAEPAGTSPDAFRAFVNADTTKWLGLARRAGIELQSP
jgi:tripartite-type tricarboxylate transporter receptor subunit TctC